MYSDKNINELHIRPIDARVHDDWTDEQCWLQYLNRTYNVDVPLILMNSFNTDDDTKRIIRKYKGIGVTIHTFNQSCYPRISRESFLPIARNCDIDEDLEA